MSTLPDKSLDKSMWTENDKYLDDKEKVPPVVDLTEICLPRKKMEMNSDEKEEMKQIKKLCPIDWYVESSDGGPVSQEVNLSLSVADGRSSTEKKADLIKNCLIFIDPNHIDSRNNCRDGKIIFGHHGLEDKEFGTKAAKASKAALQKNGSIDNIYKFFEEYDGDERFGYPWSVDTQC